MHFLADPKPAEVLILSLNAMTYVGHQTLK